MPTGEVGYVPGKEQTRPAEKVRISPKPQTPNPIRYFYEFDDGNQIMKRKEEIKLKSAYYRTFNPLLYL